ncbi:VWA domain-containing protein [Labrenzia sp. DG1229]|uniref:VWA domain-containing protein n=1 Tax=Labrenzia sp. DG1229 TaxID=681847 RepID=UPI0004922323|nr:VWA domain-containing protein [Labrenzia sp. DG1229]
MSTDQLFQQFEAFHFLRPWWLLALPAIGLLWGIVRVRPSRRFELPSVIVPHLAAALTIGQENQRRLQPVDTIAMILCLLAVATAGPVWSRVPNPLVSDTAPLVVALKVSNSMMQPDVPPNRLERAKQKILDLLKGRAGAKTALIAYAGSAHQVVPLTEDPDVIKPFLEGLEPRVMPQEGEAAGEALVLAQTILQTRSEPGSILFLLDGISNSDTALTANGNTENDATVHFWVFSREPNAVETPDGPGFGPTVAVTADARDVQQIIRNINTTYQAALSQDEDAKWRDQGVLVAWPAALLLLFWFRRGWTMRWSAVLLLAFLFQPLSDAHAEGWRDWFFTPDQQGQMAFDAKEYEKASELFQDPERKAYSLYKLGRYEEAAELYAWQDSSDAALGEGMSLMKSRAYRQAIVAFRKAVDRDPLNKAAQKNLELAEYILEYIESTREQSDTSEESGIGADDVVYDNEAGRGTETQQQPGEVVPETADQWMRTVDTRTGDFLKSRFALENARGSQ